MLAQHGYGVLLQGAPDAIGWTWQHDVAGAINWLEHRPDVDPHKVGGLGLSTGAEVLLQAAAQRHDLAHLGGRLHAPAVLIAAGHGQEARFGRISAQHSDGRAQLWQVPDAGHTHAIRLHPAAYDARVTGLFNRALQPNRSG